MSGHEFQSFFPESGGVDLTDQATNITDETIEEMRQLDLPVVNIGPFGKGAHQFTERVEIDYSYYVVPQLVYRTIENLLK